MKDVAALDNLINGVHQNEEDDESEFCLVETPHKVGQAGVPTSGSRLSMQDSKHASSKNLHTGSR